MTQTLEQVRFSSTGDCATASVELIGLGSKFAVINYELAALVRQFESLLKMEAFTKKVG